MCYRLASAHSNLVISLCARRPQVKKQAPASDSEDDAPLSLKRKSSSNAVKDEDFEDDDDDEPLASKKSKPVC